LMASPEKTLSTLKKWTNDRDEHVRRLVSEGTRPRLPWAMRLPIFIENPSPVIELLESLKDDEHEYVRRSVANNLNDIAKDHPDLVAEIAARWMKDANKERKRLIRHACRTLMKNGHKRTLGIFGYEAPEIHKADIDLLTPTVTFGQALAFTLSIRSSSEYDQPLMIDYIIHHRKANGKTSPKVFKWKTTNLTAKKTIRISKRHAIKQITTRVYHPGAHALEIMINGVLVAKEDFELLKP
ncbi:MAG: DNA alkylation repair protein, partial [Gammaproteobacteria bacterium]|nr:DNA alkylation repair protein [Gammaproteobacteria bacterium]